MEKTLSPTKASRLDTLETLRREKGMGNLLQALGVEEEEIHSIIDEKDVIDKLSSSSKEEVGVAILNRRIAIRNHGVRASRGRSIRRRRRTARGSRRTGQSIPQNVVQT